MAQPRAVSVVGFKAAGKTRVVEAIVRELTSRGRRVATVKHTAEDAPLDRPGTDTYRHAEAGAAASAIIGASRSAVFLKRSLSLHEAVEALGEADYIVLEGFKGLHLCPRIIVPRSVDEAEELRDGTEIAVADPDGLIPAQGAVPVVSDLPSLADLVEAKAHPLLAGYDCSSCGNPSCRETSRLILRGEADANRCVKYAEAPTRLTVDGRDIPLNTFTGTLLRNILLGFARSLKDAGEPRRVEVKTDG